MHDKSTLFAACRFPRITFGPCCANTTRFVALRNEALGLILKREEVGLTINEHCRLARVETQLARLVQITWPGYTGKAVER